MGRGSQLRAKFGSAQKAYRAGTHRIVAPCATAARIGNMAVELGITRIAVITGLDRIGVPVVAVHRPNSRSVAVAQGKGIDLPAARASGLMEALETHHAERIELPRIFSDFGRMRLEHATIDVHKIPTVGGLSFDDGRFIWWIEGYELINQHSVWIPYELVHTDYTIPALEGSGCLLASSNGLASGNHVYEAMIHGICEAVERDCVAIWYYLSANDQRETRLDMDTIEDPMCRGILDCFRSAGMAVVVWDVTSDIGIPAFLCWIAEEEDGRPTLLDRQAIGAGCHTSKHVALCRALTEAAQERLTVISGARDDLSPEDYQPAREATRETRDWIFETPACRSLSDIPSLEFESLEDELDWQLLRLDRAGISEVAIVDLSLDRFGIPVVRVVIPGLEAPFDLPGYTPGRRVGEGLACRAR